MIKVLVRVSWYCCFTRWSSIGFEKNRSFGDWTFEEFIHFSHLVKIVIFLVTMELNVWTFCVSRLELATWFFFFFLFSHLKKKRDWNFFFISTNTETEINQNGKQIHQIWSNLYMRVCAYISTGVVSLSRGQVNWFCVNGTKYLLTRMKKSQKQTKLKLSNSSVIPSQFRYLKPN